MRIFYFCGGFRPLVGGLEVLSEEFAAAMARRGHRIAVVTPCPPSQSPGASTYRGFTVHRLELRRALERRDLSGLRRVQGRLSEIRDSFRPDVIHWNDTGPNAFFFPYTRASSRPPSLLALHGPINLEHRHGLQQKVLLAADWVVGVSRSLLKDACDMEPAINHRSSVILNALPMPAIAPAPLPLDPPVLLCIGRVVREKGFDLAIRAMARIRHSSPGTRLIIAGDGPEKSNLEALTVQFGLQNQVELTGWTDPETIPALINQATCLLMPGRWKEPFGLVALQAAQMGRPVIATPVGGVPEVVADGDTGVMVPWQSEAALAEAVGQLLADPARAAELGANGRLRAAREFSFDRLLAQYEQLYDSLAGTGASVSGQT